MRPRTDAVVGAVVFVVLMVGAALLGRANNRIGSNDFRPSTFQSGPAGARGLAEGLERLGVNVTRLRRSAPPHGGDSTTGATILVVIEPMMAFPSDDKGDAMIDFVRSETGGDLLLAGPSTRQMMSCFGYTVQRTVFDSSQAVPPGQVVRPQSAWAHNELIRILPVPRAQGARPGIDYPAPCPVVATVAAETLLVKRDSQVVALRLRIAEHSRSVILLADPDLLRNRALRSSDAGVFALGLLAGEYQHVIFDEYHHGFREGGSLAGATWRWSLTNPIGWLIWQLALVGLLALLASGFRFGPARAGIVRTRRSHLEHVRALATALNAARGHDVAIAALVRGLRRRLGAQGRTSREDWRTWLDRFDTTVTTPRAREALVRLRASTKPGQSAQGVLAAANAMEDLWEELRP